MKVLVDFENVPPGIKIQGPIYLTDRIIVTLKPVLQKVAVQSLEFRLYGGWDENSTLTRRAQQLGSDLRIHFPRIVNSNHLQPPVPIRLQAELAQSLEVLPAKVLHNTVRRNPVRKLFSCIKPTSIGCKTMNCPIDSLADFLTANKCPVAGCGFTTDAVIKIVEQKLVDTMIVADLIHLARAGAPTIALVSSDDDMWPGIISCMTAGAHVVHIQTTGMKTSLPYRTQVKGKYTQLGIEE